MMIRSALSAGCGLAMIAASLAGSHFGNPPAPVQPVKTAPLAYFDAHCSRCHGYMGSFYGSNFGKNLSDSQLREAVRRMAAGPGGAPLSGEDLAAEVAFHRSLVAGTPFLAWTDTKVSVLHGEVTPESKLTATVDGKAAVPTLKESDWSLTLPAGAKPRSVVVTATLGGKTTTLDLSKAAFSHAKP